METNTFRVIERYEDCCAIAPTWNRIVDKHSAGILGLDVTATFEWCMTLWENFLGDGGEKILLLEREGEVAGVLPLYCSDKIVHRIKCRRIAPMTEIFSGRCGFILRESRYEDLQSIIEYLYRDLHNWDVFQVSIVDGSGSDVLFQDLLRRQGYRCERVAEAITPYIDLGVPWQEITNTLPTKVRSQLRNRQKRMAALGPWHYREYEKGTEIDEFLEAMFTVEKASWKEPAGTSLTTNDYQVGFFKRLIRVAADNGWFSGHLLTLNNEPIGYVFGILYKDIFYSCKSSYRADKKDLSPGAVIRMLMLERLHQRHINFHDWMGACQDHKMLWTNKTYTRTTYIMYNKSPRGLAAWMGGEVRSYLSCISQHFI